MVAWKPKPSPVPEVWLKSARSVTGRPRVNSLSGTFQDFRYLLTSSSSDSLPASTSRITANAVTGLLMDAAWNIVSAVTGALVV